MPNKGEEIKLHIVVEVVSLLHTTFLCALGRQGKIKLLWVLSKLRIHNLMLFHILSFEVKYIQDELYSSVVPKIQIENE